MGLGMMGLAFVASKMGGLIQATATLLSILTGPTMGVFLLGFCVPFCNFKGAMAGVFSSVVRIYNHEIYSVIIMHMLRWNTDCHHTLMLGYTYLLMFCLRQDVLIVIRYLRLFFLWLFADVHKIVHKQFLTTRVYASLIQN
jgi:hypothetical protein